MNNPTKYLGYNINATAHKDRSISLSDSHTGDYLLIPEDAFQALVKFRAAAQVEIALRQNLQPAYDFVEGKK